MPDLKHTTRILCFALLPAPLTLIAVAPAVQGQTETSSRTIALPTGKQLAEPAPGSPQRLNSLPMTAAISPDGRYLAVVNAGYGTFESVSYTHLDVYKRQVVGNPGPVGMTKVRAELPSGLVAG